MKISIKITALVLLLTLGLSSCYKEYLEPVPRTSISDLTAFDTRDRILSQVNGIYNAIKNGQYLGGRYQVYNSIRGDDFLNLQTNGVTGYLTWNHTVVASTNEVQNLWLIVYRAIGRINMFIEGMDANKDRILSENLLTEAEFNQYKGEALALRGMAYFNLCVLYARPYNQDPAGLGMVMRLTNPAAESNSKARSTVAETYTQILSDLNTAEGLLPDISSTSNSDDYVTRVHKYTIAAFKSRVYMHMNNWSQVITEANKLVPASAPFVSPNGVSYQLAANFALIFQPSYSSSESILSMPMNAAELPGTQNGIAHYFSAATVGNNEYPINTAGPIWSSTEFPVDDARRLLTTPIVVSGIDQIFLNKYPTFPHSDYVPVIRYAEVLLNLAEAEARVNGVNTRAVELLNAVFLRSNPTATAFVVGDFANADALIARILLERGMEFMGEGIKNMDTMRTLAPHGAKAGVNEVPITSPNYVWPIPETEMNTNLLCEQNP